MLKVFDGYFLSDLIDAAPILPEDLGKSMREMVALRCLEQLFGTSNEVVNDVPSVREPKHTFDFSQTCEDVLESILKETSVSDLRTSGPDLLKWDIHPFITHKRASMPKCALEQLKDAILEGTRPYAAYLTELSGLVHKNDENDSITVDSCHHNAVTGRVDSDDANAQIMAPEGSAISLPLENRNEMVGCDSHHRKLLPLKRNKSDLDNENPAGEYQEDQGDVGNDDLHLNVKRFKSDALCIDISTEQIFIPLNGKELVEDSSERMVGVTEKESCHMERESLGVLGECRSLENGHDKFVATEELGRSLNADVSAEFQHNQCENVDNANQMPSDTSGDGPCQYILVDEVNEAEPRALNDMSVRTRHKVSIDDTKANSYCGNQLKSPSVISLTGLRRDTTVEKVGMEHFYEEDPSCDGDEYDQEKFDVAMEKSHFLSSLCTLIHVSPTDWTERNLCIKCSKDGQLLVCNAVGCPLVVHSGCLGSLPSFDVEGKFYCPFCAYSHAISEYMEVKKKASLARKELSAFIHKQTESSHSKEHSKSNQYGDEDDMSGNLGRREPYQTNNDGYPLKVNGQLKKGSVDEQQVEPIVSCLHVNLMGREEEPDATHGTINISPGEKKREEMAPECLSVKALDRQDQICADPKCNGDNPMSENNEFFSSNEKQAEGGIEKEVLEQQSSDSLEKPVCAIKIDEGDIFDEGNKENMISNYSIRSRRRERQYVYPAIPQLRRKKVPWTVKEEEMLKVQNRHEQL
ncbi:hypothetical protein GH714_042465 [Hevea brasiliensis]|uniref:Zinc finger PHD-type domain-containing protein n=1 Tax=Hevea brasiliensis TaxID=3981 RepID=A0A6A6KP31_HEVBR|nr:hypothetical protein GH714_042465 [Hevea brasiliensis]